MRTQPPVRRRLAALVATALVTLPLAGCTGDDTPSLDTAAAALVSALTSGSVDGLDLTQDTSGDPQTQLTEILEPLLTASGAQQPDVSLAKLATSSEGDDAGRTATATLDWRWPLGGETVWAYQTTAELTLTEPAEGSGGPSAWTTAWTPEILVPDLQPGERLTVSTVAPTRGEILDGAGQPLVTNRAVWRIGIDKTHVDAADLDGAARALAQLVSDGGIAADADAYAQRVQDAGDKAFVELVTVRQEAPQVDVEAARQLAGVGVLADEMALAPTATFARPILGRVGEATAELIEASDGRLKQGDTTGLSGLQRQYDVQLAGSPGVSVTAAVPDGDGDPRVLFSQDPVDGTPLETTFDVGLQTRAEQVLADVGPASAIVAIRPSTGEVLAAASGPGSNGLDTAMLGKYAPGSTFKVADALAFGRQGITPDTPVACTPTITVDGREFQNVPGYPESAVGDIPLRTAFAHSCNTAMIAQRDVVSQQDLANAAQDLGFGVQTPVGAPVFYGNVPTDATATQHAATLIGQDRVEASPFTMARLAASVAAGHRVDPVLVRPAEPAAGDAASDAPSDASASPSPDASPTAEVPTSALTDAEAATLRELMGGVVQVGSATMLQDVPGIVGAKTGTAQFGDGSQQHTWMIAIAGDLAVAVFVEEGEFGSTTSGPLMHAFLTGS